MALSVPGVPSIPYGGDGKRLAWTRRAPSGAKALASKLGGDGDRVSAVTPTWSKPVQGRRIESDFRKKAEFQTPLGCIGQLEDIAPLVLSWHRSTRLG